MQKEVSVLTRLIVAIFVFALAACNGDDKGAPPKLTQTPFEPASKDDRLIVLISDSHMGYGQTGTDGTWDAMEDFRWPRAFGYFLDEIRERGSDKVDLIIVGDFLELWQSPQDRQCKPLNESLGCTVAEMVQATSDIVDAHAYEIDALRSFAKEGRNRVHIIPGNHDSSLLLANVWQPLGKKLNDQSGRINLVSSGVWVSPGAGKVVVEHGHQIGSDVNRYDDWPDMIVKPDRQGTYRMIRPWGENFVQSVFNLVEGGTENDDSYQIIDNLGPESAGVRFRMADTGFSATVSDIAKFLLFNLLETSITQKAQVLGPQLDPKTGKVIWDIDTGRGLGYRLFADALSDGDPFRAILLSNDETANAVRDELDNLATDKDRLPDADLLSLCDQIAIRQRSRLCIDQTLGGWFESTFRSRESVIKEHLKMRRIEHPGMALFIYGHTHKYEEPWDVKLSSVKTVSVANTGAFQRIVSEEGFLRRVADLSTELGRNIKPGEALRIMKLDRLAPCYTFIEVREVNGWPYPKLQYWKNPSEQTPGEIAPLHDPDCQ